ncbi:MAG: (E)-4-hydroxy-3-methylbut-2-enyl-diphosphate synthase [Bacteroidaceae bacterium]|nr:(E)-4-hydroxy-3-methylbut-2-enyl-diphosphate synthase [Bacteroidaceae bacterium]MBR5607796.1 (E)-4-hydroxy-3-methylbut-2-enyl-diphosphate synthase [Bacteroidaceae bacterium]
MNLFNYRRRLSHIVRIGGTPLGGPEPIRVQSMTNTSTMDTEASVQQVLRIAEAGGEYVRLTTQGTREAENMREINAGVRLAGCNVPLVADVHFNPKVAEVAACYCEKVRINPGNYVDAARQFKHLEYTDEEYQAELKKIEDRLIPFLQICREHRTAVRIGVNHGSLSDRIMSRYGDTPEGIVESCMEFLRICMREQFMDVVISIKASNTVIMVQSMRLLVTKMTQEGMSFPVHLGVTEAGEGEDGRIKSAVGIGALLQDGIGDTIRVSLSEAPEKEIPVARFLVDYVTSYRKEADLPVPADVQAPADYNWLKPERRQTTRVGEIGGGQVPVVLDEIPVTGAISANPFNFTPETAEFLRKHPEVVVVSHPQTVNRLGEHRALALAMMNLGLKNPLLVYQEYAETDLEHLQLKAAADTGVLFIEGLADGIILQNHAPGISVEVVRDLAYSILQAARARFTKTEYISCPGCGRTLYDLEGTIARIKAATAHLKGLKIAIMGCIVNGPGEMADADYGYVGAARGKVSLYKQKVCIEKNIPEEEAVERLLRFIEEDLSKNQE